MNFLKNSYSNIFLGKGRIECISGDSPETTVMWYTRFFDSLPFELVEILDTDELLGLPPRMARSILRAGMRQTRFVIGLLRWSGGSRSAMPSTLRLLATCNLRSSGPLWQRRLCSGVLKGRDLDEELIV